MLTQTAPTARMTPDVPAAIERRLRHTLGQWQQWQCDPPLTGAPRAMAALGRGHSNFSVLVTARGREFVVRIDGIDPARHGLNRRTEWHSLQAAHSAGLAPCPRYFNPDLGSLVYDYLPADASQRDCAEDIGLLLRAIHRLPPRHHRLDLAERVRRYEKLLGQGGRPVPDGLAAAGTAVAQILARTARGDGEPVLCHNDLLRSNRLYSGGRLYALDWEYCAMASPWYDLAVVLHGDGLDEDTAARLATAYLGRAPTRPERARLRRYGCVYRYLALLWYLAAGREAVADISVPEQLRQLEKLLAHD